MSDLYKKNCKRAELHYGRLIKMAETPEYGLDTVRLLQMLAGVLTEIYLEYEAPGKMMVSAAGRLVHGLGI